MAKEPASHPHAVLPGPHHHRPSLRHRLRRMLVTGLLILTPVALTTWFLYQLFELMDGIFAPVLTRAIGFRIPGLGLLLTLLVILLLGWLSTNVVGRRLIRWFEALIQQIPVARGIYMATKGILEAVSRNQTEAFKRVVMIEYPSKGLFALAFVTAGQDWGGVDPRLGDFLLVFLPTTPNPTSGYLLLVPKGDAIALPITVEEGIRMVISGGILLPTLPGALPEAAARVVTAAGETRRSATPPAG